MGSELLTRREDGQGKRTTAGQSKAIMSRKEEEECDFGTVPTSRSPGPWTEMRQARSIPIVRPGHLIIVCHGVGIGKTAAHTQT
jgi:hypothetical protein